MVALLFAYPGARLLHGIALVPKVTMTLPFGASWCTYLPCDAHPGVHVSGPWRQGGALGPAHPGARPYPSLYAHPGVHALR